MIPEIALSLIVRKRCYKIGKIHILRSVPGSAKYTDANEDTEDLEANRWFLRHISVLSSFRRAQNWANQAEIIPANQSRNSKEDTEDLEANRWILPHISV